jgi:hypothetical protein
VELIWHRHYNHGSQTDSRESPEILEIIPLYKRFCKLCQKEQVALLRHSWMDELNMLNDRALNFMDPFTIQLGSIGYSCGQVLMILNRMKG